MIPSVQVTIRDEFGNTPDASAGGADGFTAEFSTIDPLDETVNTLAFTLPLLTNGDGSVRAERLMEDTGTFSVAVLLGVEPVPGGSYEVIVSPGPPHGPFSTMQVRSGHPSFWWVLGLREILRNTRCLSDQLTQRSSLPALGSYPFFVKQQEGPDNHSGSHPGAGGGRL